MANIDDIKQMIQSGIRVRMVSAATGASLFDKKVVDLPVVTDPLPEDSLIYVVEDPSGTPLDKKALPRNLGLQWVYGGWVAGTYYRNQMARDGNWVFICSALSTTDRPAPQPSGSPVYVIGSAPAWNTKNDTGYVSTGTKYTFNRIGYIQAFRVWIPVSPSAGGYRYTAYAVATDPGTGIKTLLGSFTIPDSALPGWNDYAVDPRLVFPGEVYEVILESQNNASATEILSGRWRYEGTSQSNDPTPGGWNTDIQNIVLRLNEIDLDTNNQSVAIDAIVVGDVIEVVAAGANWHYLVNELPVNTVGEYIFGDVTRIIATGTIGTGTFCDLLVQRATVTTDYVDLTDFWLTNIPAWASDVKGTLELTAGSGRVDDNHGYGAEFLWQDYVTSPDWDLVSLLSR